MEKQNATVYNHFLNVSQFNFSWHLKLKRENIIRKFWQFLFTFGSNSDFYIYALCCIKSWLVLYFAQTSTRYSQPKFMTLICKGLPMMLMTIEIHFGEHIFISTSILSHDTRDWTSNVKLTRESENLKCN